MGRKKTNPIRRHDRQDGLHRICAAYLAVRDRGADAETELLNLVIGQLRPGQYDALMAVRAGHKTALQISVATNQNYATVTGAVKRMTKLGLLVRRMRNVHDESSKAFFFYELHPKVAKIVNGAQANANKTRK